MLLSGDWAGSGGDNGEFDGGIEDRRREGIGGGKRIDGGNNSEMKMVKVIIE